jgi:hypothetical protein
MRFIGVSVELIIIGLNPNPYFVSHGVIKKLRF